MQWNYREIEARAWAALEDILYEMVGDGSDVLVHRKVEVFRRECYYVTSDDALYRLDRLAFRGV